MKTIAITGNIGSGKSVISEMFTVLKVPVFNADTEAKKLYERSDVLLRVREIFGNAVFDSDANLQLKVLSQIVFKDPIKLSKLNALLHPLTLQAFASWCESKKQFPLVGLESAIIFESNIAHLFDYTLHVSAPEAVCLKRVVNRDNTTDDLAKERMRNQWSDVKKSQLADFVIKNDESCLVIPQVFQLFSKLMRSLFDN